MKAKRVPLIAVRTLVFGALVWCIIPSALAPAAEKDCLACHGKLAKGKAPHPALAMGCPTCHTAIDAGTVPHKKTSTITKGLSAEQPDLCYGCHDKALFNKKNVHAAVGMGCTGCHDPHATDGPKLLKSKPPDLCFTCHDKAEFSKKNIHAPVAGGMCMSCHTPHSADTMALLAKEPLMLCLDCHGDVEKKPHAIRGITGAGHPIGKKDKKDPKRPDKQFSCVSCHNPHSSAAVKLFRYPAKATMGLCINCHKF